MFASLFRPARHFSNVRLPFVSLEVGSDDGTAVRARAPLGIKTTDNCYAVGQCSIPIGAIELGAKIIIVREEIFRWILWIELTFVDNHDRIDGRL